ncbi:MAG: response regulator [Opitutae bacterium]|nr:response regulator [Opitutae bacterium]
MPAPKHILIVDDEAVILDLLAEVLTLAGHRVSQAATVAAARKVLADGRPDLVITDLQLEQSDGLALLAEVKAAHPDLPTLLLTGVLFDEETVEARLRDKVSAYLPKTTPLKFIVAEVARLLG